MTRLLIIEQRNQTLICAPMTPHTNGRTLFNVRNKQYAVREGARWMCFETSRPYISRTFGATMREAIRKQLRGQ